MTPTARLGPQAASQRFAAGTALRRTSRTRLTAPGATAARLIVPHSAIHPKLKSLHGTGPAVSLFASPSQNCHWAGCNSVAANANKDDVEKENMQNGDDSWDPVMIAGDTLMLIATELSSDRIPLQDQGFLCFVVCASWTLVAYARGDYNSENLDLEQFEDFWILAPMLASMQAALYTWVVFVLLVAGLLAYLVSANLFDPAILQHGENESPAMTEVLVGSVLTMASWRGIYAGLFF
eukprot:CAMPEP_0117676004 /NCGR_PEP_ID=MMETSP0804-20121206/15919_1 /TAXON_ID=1074897 /ORGANISM="Tetraselmis astigmatica, Strain CCMP880" /LENGTH=236 /DNA_ID=CAMNT_0005485069 /DNA_START=160 /DNA_END=870 /DNA_ORIENTATION=-